MDILNDIHYWIIELENNEHFNISVTRIKSPRNPLLRMRVYKDCVHYIYCGNSLLYHTIKY